MEKKCSRHHSDTRGRTMSIIRKIFGLKPKYKLKTKSYKKFRTQLIKIDENKKSDSDIVILTKPHTSYFANLLGFHFARHKMNSIITPYDIPAKTTNHKIIFCPQTYNNLPDEYIGYQTEQTTNDRFFQSSHLDILKKSSIMIDYALGNINFLKPQMPNTQFYHLPVAYCPDYTSFLIKHGLISSNDICPDDDRPYDVIFYGDPRNERRQAYLTELQKHFKIKIICGVFGMDVVKELLKAKIIVNIHYFDQAILEIGRIYESMSLGCHVISEKAIDQEAHAGLEEFVDFTEIDNIQGMVTAVEHALNNQKHRTATKNKALKSNLDKTLIKNFDTFIADIYKKGL